MSGPADVIICDNGTGVGACCPLYPLPTSLIIPPSLSWTPWVGYCPSPVPSVVLADSWYRYPGESKGCLCDGAVPGLTRPASPANPCPLCLTPFACSSSSAAWQGTTCRGTPFPAWWGDPCCVQRRGPSGTGTTCRWVPYRRLGRETRAFGKCFGNVFCGRSLAFSKDRVPNGNVEAECKHV
jgi:hypothetical protein